MTPGLVATASLVVSLIRGDDNDDEMTTMAPAFPCCGHHLCQMEAPSLREAGKVPRRLTSWSQWSVPSCPRSQSETQRDCTGHLANDQRPALWGLHLSQPAVLSQLCSAWGISVKGRTPNGLLHLFILPQNDLQPQRAVAFPKGGALICRKGIKLRPLQRNNRPVQAGLRTDAGAAFTALSGVWAYFPCDTGASGGQRGSSFTMRRP